MSLTIIDQFSFASVQYPAHAKQPKRIRNTEIKTMSFVSSKG